MNRELNIARDLRETAGLLVGTKYASRVELLEEAATIIEDSVIQSEVLNVPEAPEVEISHTEIDVDVPELTGDVEPEKGD